MAQGTTYRQRHTPQRSCAGCGAKRSKREMVRIVRLPSGEVVIDLTGKRPGRGTYLCPTLSCWENALKRGRLEHALRGPLPSQAREAIRAYAAAHLAGAPAQAKEA